MRKLIPISAVFAFLGLLSMNDYNVCSGELSTNKAACSACHLSSVSGTVFIIDGKVEDDGGRMNENDYEYEATIRIPLTDFAVFQVNTLVEENFPGRVDVDLAATLVDLKESSLFSLSDLFQRKSTGKETEDIKIRFTLDEKLTESKTVIIQGVLGNGDGTLKGDQAFYQEITLEPRATNLSIIEDGVKYYPSHMALDVVGINKVQNVRIIDLQGKVVLQTLVENNALIDVAKLESGYYIAVVGNSGKEIMTYKFKK